ncbi:hypothetical protein MPTK1_4g11650 [Marchantia polymorpha subsp. ruderalis]|uniref:Hypervirulence associated protein TUDOR domain-containing protein n=2 Tax=Marchantia polymorpha TaxID=3197 RepID=A0AAF6B8W6_MARPO|nr:hypothetical protein MARPO_0011s0150 [Marchantia polymorpha]PTQ46486.1 hypothetical protein MARPO_0011s0150 [Marchantia polymorpha]BBN08449.1 hypothetical protein Mp_4g11650 [Marchantia polymorpha subsp. ruderalis]BBN08450.1 hypothetical protein Mp_4g11650 [Marchantia polymorpha subsp. ruderalis]|eukprot:PTQ46485.1 hypothetical protein MARPO_0011s0150 [Marchantia polymorpha]
MAQAQMKPEFEKGDHVSWKYGAGKATGYIVEKLTEPAKLGTKKFQASVDEPRYKIKSDKSGKMAIRNPETLEKIDDEEHDNEEDRTHENGAEEDDEEEEVHAEDGDEEKPRADAGHDAASGDQQEDEEEQLNGHHAEDGEQNGSRKRQKSEAPEKPVDDVEAAEEPAWQLGGDEADDIGVIEEENNTNGKHEKAEVDGKEANDKEEAPHRMPHLEASQPEEVTDLNSA